MNEEEIKQLQKERDTYKDSYEKATVKSAVQNSAGGLGFDNSHLIYTSLQDCFAPEYNDQGMIVDVKFKLDGNLVNLNTGLTSVASSNNPEFEQFKVLFKKPEEKESSNTDTENNPMASQALLQRQDDIALDKKLEHLAKTDLDAYVKVRRKQRGLL